MAWWLVWPLELVKSQVQSGYIDTKKLDLKIFKDKIM
jgi:hypothetical protein